MNTRIRSLFLALGPLVGAAAIAACSSNPYAAYGAATTTQTAGTMSGPTHPPTAASEWPTLDARAKEAAMRGGDELATSFHALGSEMAPPSPCVIPGSKPQVICASHDVPVQANHCYTVAVAWGYAATARVSVMFGTGVNRSLAGKNFEGTSGSASDRFCADGDGSVNVQVYALRADRAMLMSELLEYSVAVAAHAESPQETAARQGADATKAANGEAAMERNVFVSEMRQHGQAFARGCERCRKVGASRDQFEACAQAMGTDRFGTILCHPPVR